MFKKILKLVNERVNPLTKHILSKDLELLKSEVLSSDIKTYPEFQKWLESYYGLDFWDIMNKAPIFNQTIYDKSLTNDIKLSDLLTPEAPAVYKKIGGLPIIFQPEGSFFSVGKTASGEEIPFVSIDNRISVLDRPKQLVHEIEHALNYIVSPDFYNKSYKEHAEYFKRNKEEFKITSDEDFKLYLRDMIKERKAYKNLPLEKVANANAFKRMLAQQHFKSPEEFWNLEIEPNIGK